MQAHERFAIGVTLLTIAITLSGMAIVSKRPLIWRVGLVIGSFGGLIELGGVWIMFE